MTVKPKWGQSHVVPENAIAAWGARLIVTQDGDVDILWDRQGGDNGAHTDSLLDLMEERFSITTLRATLSELLKSYEMNTRVGEDFILYLDDRLVVHANTNGSAGYCYVTAWSYEKPAPVSMLDLAHRAETYELEHNWKPSDWTGNTICKVCHTLGIGDPDDKCEGPTVWGLWHGGASFSSPSIEDDLEKFEGLRYAKECFEERFHADRYPATFHPVTRFPTKDSYDTFLPGVSGSQMTLWFYDPREESDPYPDLLLKQDDNDQITEELT